MLKVITLALCELYLSTLGQAVHLSGLFSLQKMTGKCLLQGCMALLAYVVLGGLAAFGTHPMLCACVFKSLKVRRFYVA